MKFCIWMIVIALELFLLFDVVKGHGMMLDPVGRSSRWRFDISAEPNYSDMGLNCGGFGMHYNENGGKCGLCGDNFADPTPRDNELGGLYGGTGDIVQIYESSSINEFVFNITALHGGYVYFELCNLDKFGTESEECFAEHRLKFANGKDKHKVRSLGEHWPSVVLPNGLLCDHCIVRWVYYCGNNMAFCEDGIERLGCGLQETFVNCADIRIV